MERTFEAVIRLLAAGEVVVLSGAGLSTDSGIPDYRGPGAVARRHTPMTYQTFRGDPAARQRYWARSHLGWHLMTRARPNAGHRAVARLQHAGLVPVVLTQNVDGLHTAAGSDPVVELHGRLDQVVCLACGRRGSRAQLHRRLLAANPGFTAADAAVNPDGDVDLPDEHVATFRTVDCADCGSGPLKPDVVFFGETVPPARVAHCTALVERAHAVLVLGSSLTVLSGRRFVIQAAKQDIPVVIVNQGPTRGDRYARHILNAPLGTVLPALTDRLTTGVAADPAPTPATV
ncbi:NAD-dependent protein deacetylase [Micromonospora yangpuensis]|uniref:NAD-dependent protein deacetylase n=1 Tax=Micromonospora yangpuensis TaxID=683228 RepID=A0A1C6UQD1_9ACTN|nr:NAD-dependent protein deacetylase [Micromonospora yangpuensis]GGM07632.1 NAD-dependent protein deacetylase 1 [Micromonospora yangpuensis]SCL56277.1 NAD-dependent protein deacetylase, SIR2 family [Micromonospora yangpuensis]